ncbi:MAG: glycogen debranching enzyme N-terminal domain-containing protein [Pseudobutyrivibrio sp.]|nr:glycogen debranching enzyme N-terminal domain-containing protein [Pseudobutyrivibrio sp.]
MHYFTNNLPDFNTSQLREWVITNGIGGYCGTSIIGSLSRTHHGYLIASLHAPTKRYLCLSKIDETAAGTSLATNQYKGQYCESGNQYLSGIQYDGNMHFFYQTADMSIEKEITMAIGENKVYVRYIIDNHLDEADFTITPFFNYRDHNDNSTVDTLEFTEQQLDGALILCPKSAPTVKIAFHYGNGKLVSRDKKYAKDIELQIEVNLENEGLEDHYTPYDICYRLPRGISELTISCQLYTDNNSCTRLECDPFAARLNRIKRLEEQSGLTDDFALMLVAASDQFIAYRQSTGYNTVLAGLPWFTDWGRDTMIAFTGLTLVTRRFEEARGILKTFAQYAKNGIVPNMFPDDGLEPLYNTADASLWYFYAVHNYLKYDPSEEGAAFIREEIYPKLLEIIEAYKNGTDNSIYMDTDSLICAGSGTDQVTWMDVRVGDWVPTPRHGKPVEINALWINALKITASLMRRFNDTGFEQYEALADNAAASFNEIFWCEEKQCLYDVISTEGVADDHFRCNQLYAISLPYSILPKDKEKAVVDFVQSKLYVGKGIRTLTIDHPDYQPIYDGALEKRDPAYHQGTAWGYIMGAFITAYVKTHGHDDTAKKEALRLLEPVKEHLLSEGCIGSINEIFWGDAPHKACGCYAQAWSVGEVLRALAEDVL